MNKMKQAILAGLMLTAIGAGEAQAHNDDSNCFSYRSGAGSVEICTGPDIRHHDRRTGKEDHGYDNGYYHHARHPVFPYGPPGHREKVRHHKHDREYSGYIYKDGQWWQF